MSSAEFIDKLAQLRSMSCENLPTPELAVLTRTTARLRRSGILTCCLQLGETAPDFAIGDDHLYRLLDEGPVVINFFRGLWCSFCQTELEAYDQVKSDLAKLGCSYVAISPQALSAADDLAPTMIHDQNNGVARKFGLVYSLEAEEIELFRGWGLDLEKANQCTEWELPLPATYVIDVDRTVMYQFVDADFRARCCPEELVTEIRQRRS